LEPLYPVFIYGANTSILTNQGRVTIDMVRLEVEGRLANA